MSLLLGVIVGPPIEELVFRGLLYRAWANQWGALVAAVLTSALFAAYHPNFLAAFSSAILFVCLVRRTGSLWASISVHAFTNSDALVSDPRAVDTPRRRSSSRRTLGLVRTSHLPRDLGLCIARVHLVRCAPAVCCSGVRLSRLVQTRGWDACSSCARVSFALLTTIAGALVAAVLGFFIYGEYTRKARVTGVIVPGARDRAHRGAAGGRGAGARGGGRFRRSRKAPPYSRWPTRACRKSTRAWGTQ